MIPPEIKDEVIRRAGGRCEYCRSLRKYSPQPFTIDHIIPVSKLGKSDSDNLALACGGCNGHKYSKVEALDPVSGKMANLYNPRKDFWHDHFRWNQRFTYIIGITDKGRATVDALKLNRKELVNLREITKLTGEHPPEK